MPRRQRNLDPLLDSGKTLDLHSLLVIGPGYVGFETARRAVLSGRQVYALTRNPEKSGRLRETGIFPLSGDLTRPETLPEFPPVSHILFAAAPDGRGESDYEAVYRNGLRHILERLSKVPRKVIWISSTSVWGSSHQGALDEKVKPEPGEPKPRILLDCEELILKARIPAVVFRLAGIYGPGRNRLRAFREGRWPEASAPLRYLNLIHREDAVRGIDFLFHSGVEGEVYTGCDLNPLTNREAAEWLSSRVPRQAPLPVWPEGAKVSGKICSSAKLRALGFQFMYESFQDGYSALLESGEE